MQNNNNDNNNYIPSTFGNCIAQNTLEEEEILKREFEKLPIKPRTARMRVAPKKEKDISYYKKKYQIEKRNKRVVESDCDRFEEAYDQIRRANRRLQDQYLKLTYRASIYERKLERLGYDLREVEDEISTDEDQ